MWVYAHECRSLAKVRGIRSPWSLAPYQAVVTHLKWIKGSELRSSKRAVCTLNPEPSLQPPAFIFIIFILYRSLILKTTIFEVEIKINFFRENLFLF